MTPAFDLPRRLTAEALGTALLVAAVVGSGVMADQLTDDVALALLCNALATGAMLVVLVATLGPISGAHFNPAVSLVFAFEGQLSWRDLGFYATTQVVGGLLGTMIANLMFGLPLFELSTTARAGAPLWFSEAIATFGLIAVILAGFRFDRSALPWLVGLYITAAYWFTASTSFANPAVTIARTLSNTFAGIRPSDAPAFVVAQVLGAALALALMSWLLRKQPDTEL